MNVVERTYRRELGQWSGQQRVERSAALLTEMREMLARKLLASTPAIDAATLDRRVAECLYRTDLETQRLLSLLDE